MSTPEFKVIVGPNGKILPHIEEDRPTSRTLERKQEDEQYIPVIVKRTDEAVKHPDDILEKAIKEGIEQHKRPWFSLFLSAMAAGLILGVAAMSVGIVSQIVSDLDNRLLQRFLIALIYPLGFIVCLMSGNQLFTEHTATAVYPVLDRKARFRTLFGVWGVVLAGNLVGTFLISTLIHNASPVIGADSGFMGIFHHFISYEGHEVLLSAVLAGWLMAQGGWLVMATPPASSQILCIYIVTFLIGLGGFHHSIAGAAEVFLGLLTQDSGSWLPAIKVLGISVLGNLIGGSLFVGILNYAHIRQTQ